MFGLGFRLLKKSKSSILICAELRMIRLKFLSSEKVKGQTNTYCSSPIWSKTSDLLRAQRFVLWTCRLSWDFSFAICPFARTCLPDRISTKCLLTVAHDYFTELGDWVSFRRRLSDISSINKVPLDRCHVDEQKIVFRALAFKNTEFFIVGIRISKKHSERVVCWQESHKSKTRIHNFLSFEKE